MTHWSRFLSTVGGVWLLSILGGTYVAIGVGRAMFVVATERLITAALLEFIVIGGPGLALLYGAHRVAKSDLRPDTYPRIVAWCLGGFSAMLGVVVLLLLNPVGNIVDQLARTAVIVTGLGSLGGLANGINQGRAFSRAHDAEQHRDELRRERDLRERIVRTSPIGITISDVDGTIRMVNERAAQITGLSEAELLDLDRTDPSPLGMVDADGNPVGGAAVRTVTATGEPVYNVERRITAAGGEQVWLSMSVAPLQDSAGNPTAVVTAYKDITERKAYERQLEVANERLEQFAYATSHDLQEPLRMVSSYLRILENRYRDELDEDAVEFIAFAVDGADRMRMMVDSLHEYSRVTTGGEPLEPIDSAAIVESVLDDLQPRIEDADAVVSTDELPTVTADAEQLARVFRNLIANALEYSGDESPRIRISAEDANGEWQFAVADDGIGIESRYHDRIFEVFESVHADADGSSPGIGLALCERIVERHGGEIWVDSAPDEGSTFYVTVPAGE